ncbi:MAG: glycosyltransferase family 4 protein [Acidimicrobiia bacterium]
MRVALNLEQLLQTPPGGVGRYTAELARLLPGLDGGDRDDAVELVPFVARHRTADVTEALNAWRLGGLDPVVLPLPRPVLYDAWHVVGAPGLRGVARTRGALDVVHAPSVAVPPTGRYRLVVTVHDAAPLLFPDTYPRRGRWFHRRGIAAAARRADLVITVSQAAADEIQEHTAIPAERMRVVPNGVELTEASDDDATAARAAFDLGARPYVLWLGSLEPRKNVGLLVEAFARWAATSDVPHQLVLAGPAGWVEDRDTVLAPARRLGDRVRTIGRVGDDHLRGLYRGADVFVLPSRHEGFGLPVLEAMAQGTPVVASDIPSLREVAGDAARLVTPFDPDAWAGALDDLLHDRDRHAHLGAAGRRRAELFSWERCASETRAVYREARALPH